MSVMMNTLYQITVLALVCGGLLTLGGRGGQREILRLGCACLMVVVMLSAVQKIDLPALNLSRYEDAVQQQVEEAQKDMLKATLKQTETALAEQLKQQAAALGLDCTVAVTCGVDGANTVNVQQVEIGYHSGPRENLVKLRERIQTQLAVGESQLVIREETP